MGVLCCNDWFIICQTLRCLPVMYTVCKWLIIWPSPECMQYMQPKWSKNPKTYNGSTTTRGFFVLFCFVFSVCLFSFSFINDFIFFSDTSFIVTICPRDCYQSRQSLSSPSPHWLADTHTHTHTQQVKTETNRAEQWRNFHLHRKEKKRERELIFCFVTCDRSIAVQLSGEGITRSREKKKKTSVSVPLKWKWTHGSVSVGFKMMWQWFHLLMSRMSMKTSEVFRTADFTSHTRPSWYTPNSPRWAAPLYISQLIRRVFFFLFFLKNCISCFLSSTLLNFTAHVQMSFCHFCRCLMIKPSFSLTWRPLD